MRIEFRALMQGMPALTAICENRIDWGKRLPRDPYPGICLHLISGSEGNTLKGKDGLITARVQVDCYGEEYVDAVQLAAAVKAELDGFRQGGFRRIVLDSERDNNERGSNEPDRASRISMDFLVNWRQSNA